MNDPECDLFAIRIIAENRKGVLRDISTVLARHEANVIMIHQEIFDSGHFKGLAELYLEYENGDDSEGMTRELLLLPAVREVKPHEPFSHIYGTRVIIIGGGAQVAQVALGAVNEADRHNIRGERISVDTIPLVGEKTVAQAVDAVARLPRAAILVLAGSLMGGEISSAVDRVRDGQAGGDGCSAGEGGTIPFKADALAVSVERATRFELATLCLGSRCATAALRPDLKR